VNIVKKGRAQSQTLYSTKHYSEFARKAPKSHKGSVAHEVYALVCPALRGGRSAAANSTASAVNATVAAAPMLRRHVLVLVIGDMRQ